MELKSKFVLNINAMTVSSIDKELIKYFIQLTEPQKQSLLQMIKTFIKAGNNASEDFSIEQYNKELNDAMHRIGIGNFTTLEELENEMQSW
jgi:hypothetical protein